MERKTLTLRLPTKLYNALSTLSEVAHRSMNDLISETLKLVAAKSEVHARDLEKTLESLRAYTQADPDFEQAIAEFAAAEVEYDDPLEGEPGDKRLPPQADVLY